MTKLCQRFKFKHKVEVAVVMGNLKTGRLKYAYPVKQASTEIEKELIENVSLFYIYDFHIYLYLYTNT